MIHDKKEVVYFFQTKANNIIALDEDGMPMVSSLIRVKL